MIDQEKIHNQHLSNSSKERIQALEQLESIFSSLPNKQQVWNELFIITFSKDFFTRFKAVSVLSSAFSQLPDKQQAWNDLLRLTNDENRYVKHRASDILGSVFSQIPDKQQAWNDLLRLTDVNSYVGFRAASYLVSALSQVPDKQQAWNDLYRLTNDENNSFSSSAAEALGSAFFQASDKQQAWNDLHRMTNDKDNWTRFIAAETLGSVFSQVPDNQKAWNDLHRLVNDENSRVRSSATKALGSMFSQIQDKQKTWNDLHRLTNDENESVRSSAAHALGSVFFQVANKQQTWNDLHRLTSDKDIFVRSSAAHALGSVFFQVPDKQQAWNDLHRLTNDENQYVRHSAAEALGSVFFQVPDKQQAWNDLLRLTNDENSDVRTSSNHSFGRVSIFMASQAKTDEDYKRELEKAIEFFEIAAKESTFYNPAQFCLPFFRTFHTILFKRQEAKEEVDRYLGEAKSAIEESKSKKLLIEAVENLARALDEVQNLEKLELQDMKSELNFYRKYCEYAAELLKDTDEKAPFAAEVLRKGLPILDRNLKELIEEIQEKAKTACQVSQGTATEEIACAVNKEIQKWEIGSQEEMTQMIENLAFVLEEKISFQPKNQFILSKIEKMKNESNLVNQYEILAQIIPLIKNVTVVPAEPVIEKIEGSKKEILEEIRKISEKLDYIAVSTKPEINEELILHLGYITSVGGIEYTLTIPLQGISYFEIKEELKEVTGKRINQLSMLPKKVDKIVREYFVENKMEDLLSKLC